MILGTEVLIRAFDSSKRVFYCICYDVKKTMKHSSYIDTIYVFRCSAPSIMSFLTIESLDKLLSMVIDAFPFYKII